MGIREDHLYEGLGIHFPDAQLVVRNSIMFCYFKIIKCIYVFFYLFFCSLEFVGSKKIHGVTNNSKLEKL